MNKYGKFAQDTWKMTAPTQYALIPDPDEWFRKLGEEAMNQVGELQYQIAGPDPEGETYLQKVGRLSAAKLQAEEIVLAEYQPPSDSPEPDEPEGWDSMPHDQQESWIRENVPEGEEQQQMLQDLEGRRLTRMVVLGASYDPQDYEQD